MLRMHKHSASIFGFFLIVGISLPAKGESLLSNSPFLPAEYGRAENRTPGPVEQGNKISELLEFRGMLQFDGSWEFSLYNRQRERSDWLALGEVKSSLDYKVIGFDFQEGQIEIEWNNRHHFLNLSEASGFNLRRENTPFVNLLRTNPAPPPSDLNIPDTAPPPPPISSPPPGPPPEIPRNVMEQFEKMAAEKNPEMRPGMVFSGRSGSPPSDPGDGLSARPPIPPTGDNGVGSGNGDGDSESSTPSVQIPNLPGVTPGGGPPSGPPNIDIPEIPDFPDGEED